MSRVWKRGNVRGMGGAVDEVGKNEREGLRLAALDRLLRSALTAPVSPMTPEELDGARLVVEGKVPLPPETVATVCLQVIRACRP